MKYYPPLIFIQKVLGLSSSFCLFYPKAQVFPSPSQLNPPCDTAVTSVAELPALVCCDFQHRDSTQLL